MAKWFLALDKNHFFIPPSTKLKKKKKYIIGIIMRGFYSVAKWSLAVDKNHLFSH
jgi:hypothetical protein